MKRHLQIFLLASIVFTSCSSDNQNGSTPNTGKLIKKITQTQYDGTPDPQFVMESVFNYQGNVLINTVSGSPGSADTFTGQFQYDGNKITKILYFQNDETTPYGMKTFTYEGNLLKYIDDNTIYERRDHSTKPIQPILEASLIIRSIRGMLLCKPMKAMPDWSFNMRHLTNTI